MIDQECLDMLYENVSQYLAIPKDSYASMLEGWDVSQMIVHEKMVGVAMQKDHEMHVCLTRENAVKYGRRLVKKYVVESIKNMGYITTVSMKDEKCTRFLERLGFYRTSETPEFINYRLDKLTLNRGALCHQ